MKHDVSLRIECALPERLIERALDNGAELARIERIAPRAVRILCDDRSARIIGTICAQHDIALTIERNIGLSAIRKRLRSRATLAAGALLAFAICLWFFARIWIIDIRFSDGADYADKRAEVNAALTAQDIVRGVLRDALDTKTLTARLAALGDEFSFVGVDIDGVTLRVELSREVPAPSLYDISYARDLVARCDGIVTDVYARAGTACVKPGDVVTAGQLLIRGDERKSAEELSAVNALGTVRARIWFEGTAQGALAQNIVRFTGRCDQSSYFTLFGRVFALHRGTHFVSQSVERTIQPIGGVYLPLELVREQCLETEVISIARERNALKRELETLSLAQARSAFAAANLNEAEIARIWADSNIENGQMRTRTVIEANADIAVWRNG